MSDKIFNISAYEAFYRIVRILRITDMLLELATENNDICSLISQYGMSTQIFLRITHSISFETRTILRTQKEYVK